MAVLDRSKSRAASPLPLPTTLIAGVVVQCCQALVWMVSGLIIGIDGFGAGLRHHDPSAVVSEIAAIAVFSMGGFGVALAAGTLSRSEECRIVSAVLQLVFAGLLMAGSLDVIDTRHGVLTMVLDPALRIAQPLTPALIVLLPASCLAAAILLLAARARPTS